MTGIIQNLETLCGIPGVSGDEQRIRGEIRRQIDPLCTRCHTDPLGNLIAFKKGAKTPKNKLLFSAHMDEIGFIITFVEDSGLLRFAAVGGIDSRVVIGKGVEVGDARVGGVIGSKAVHMQKESERETAPKLEELFIDIGATSREAALEAVRPGDRAVFHSPFLRLGGDRLAGRAFDDRAGCAVLISLLEQELPYDCYFAFTVQEETGCVGAKTAAFTVAPDISVAVETTTASDIAGTDNHKVVCALEGGPVLSFMDKGTVYDTGLYRLALSVAGECDISVQSKLGVYGGNDSRSLQTAGAGSRAMAISLPCRYIHSPTNVLHQSDLLYMAKLLGHLIPALAQA